MLCGFIQGDISGKSLLSCGNNRSWQTCGRRNREAIKGQNKDGRKGRDFENAPPSESIGHFVSTGRRAYRRMSATALSIASYNSITVFFLSTTSNAPAFFMEYDV